MASSCPVVATRVGGLPDLIEDHKTGRLVGPGDAEALAKGVIDLLSNPITLRELGENAREAVRTHFTIERLVGDMERLYTQLLEEKAIFSPMRDQAKP
jgi:glycosyltransferase involved in cell wall biosynthesis